MKVVFDTNIYVSFLLVSSPSPILKLLEFWQQGKLEVFISPEILQELARVLSDKKLKRYLNLSQEDKNNYLRLITQEALVVKVNCRVDLIEKDPTDNKFLELAKTIKANFIISGDKHLLKLAEFQGTKIVSAREFVEMIEKRDKNR